MLPLRSQEQGGASEPNGGAVNEGPLPQLQVSSRCLLYAFSLRHTRQHTISLPLSRALACSLCHCLSFILPLSHTQIHKLTSLYCTNYVHPPHN
jgi:hypothetical protein